MILSNLYLWTTKRHLFTLSVQHLQFFIEGLWPIELQRGMVWLTKRWRARTKTNQLLSFGPGTNHCTHPFLCLAERERESELHPPWRLRSFKRSGTTRPDRKPVSQLGYRSIFIKSLLCRLSDCNLQIKNMCFLCLFSFARFRYFASDFLRSCRRVSYESLSQRLDPRDWGSRFEKTE